jgi:hypothetical protein
MAVLTAVLTHLDAERATRQLAYLRALAPRARFVLCHGGSRKDYDELAIEDALFIEDPSLRGPNKEQSYNEALTAVYDGYVRDDSTVELVYFTEYDQLILSGDFEESLAALAQRSPAGLFAKHASPRMDTNWPHSIRYRDDERLMQFIAGISRREDREQLWGCLGTGLLFRRDALREFCSVTDAPHAYLEMFIPTVVHHLGFEVANVDALGDLYANVRWRPPYTVEEAVAAKRAGRTFLHPFTELDGLDRVSQAESTRPSAENSSTAGSSLG